MQATKFAIIPLFLTIFVDALGMGLIFPILTPLFIDNHSPLFDSSFSQEIRHYLFGILLAIYPLMTFLGSPWLGTLSDKHGRKSVLLVCMLGNFLGLLMMGLGVAANSILIIILGRIISGITAASLPIAQAAIIDLSSPETKAKFMSIITAANAIGFSLGPVVSGIFSHGSFGFTPATPFFIVGILPFLTTILLLFLFKETLKGNKEIKVTISKVFYDIYSTFKIKSTMVPSFILCLFLFAYYAAFNYFSTYFLIKLELKEITTLALLAYYSVWSAIGLLFIVPYLTGKLTLKQNLLLSVAVQPLLLFCMITIKDASIFWITLAPFAIMVANGYVTLLTILSNGTTSEHQGRIMGVTSSISALTWGIAPLVSALLAPLAVSLPLIASTIAFICAAIISFKYFKTKNPVQEVSAFSGVPIFPLKKKE